MKHRTFLYLLFFQLIALTLLFPYTPNGQGLMDRLFPSGNFGEDVLLSELEEIAAQRETESETEPIVISDPIPLSDFYREVRDELPGLYQLVSVHTEDETINDDLLSRLQALGVPMLLELHADRTSIFGVFDQAVTPVFDFDCMQVSLNGKTLPFFYLDSMLRIQDSEYDLIFEKQQDIRTEK